MWKFIKIKEFDYSFTGYKVWDFIKLDILNLSL
jgi:hypothetical protein